jgi:ADP-L-glycero-D-manno-heptose 6-epimerase
MWLWCKENGVRFVNASSAATYGDGSAGFKDEESIAALANTNRSTLWRSKHSSTADRAAKGKESRPAQCLVEIFQLVRPERISQGGMRSVAHQIFPLRKGAKLSPSSNRTSRNKDGGQLRYLFGRRLRKRHARLLDRPKDNGLFNMGRVRPSSSQIWRAVYKALAKSAIDEPRLPRIRG